MKLTDTEIDFIKSDIIRKGVDFDDLADDLVDHICCAIENSDTENFETAYKEAIDLFGSFGPKEIQKNTLILLTLKKEIIMKTAMFILGYLSATLISTGALFKMMHWPGANVMIVLGIGFLNFGFLPMYFYGRYKKSLT